MGNCSQKSSAAAATGKVQSFVRIMTDTGRVIEHQGPKIAREVLDDFPGYGIYQRGQLSLPLFEDELLCNGQVYYLLPFGVAKSNVASPVVVPDSGSFSFRRDQSSSLEVLPSSGDGVWRVKMAIDSRELEEMLSENAEALIQMMRNAARSSAKSPGRNLGRRTIGLISSGFKSPASGRLTAC